MEGMIAFVLFGFAALTSGLATVVVARGKGIERSDRRPASAALALTALWACAAAALGTDRALVHLAEVARNLAWLYVLFRLFGNDGRDETVRAVRPLAAALGVVEALQLVLILIAFGATSSPQAPQFAFETSALLRILLGIGALVLLHNLVAGAAESSRRLLAWNAGGLTLLWGFFLNFHTVAFLTGSASAELTGLRALVVGVAAPVFALGYVRGSAQLRFRTSRSVTFSMLSLGLIAIYLVAMVLLSQWVARYSGDLARIAQVGFLLVAGALSLLWLPSRRMRGWLRVTVLKHFFRHRFDYRSEWIRFTHTIGRAPDGETPLSERAVKSLADITDSPGGLLLLMDGDGGLVLGADWRWPGAEVPPRAMSAELARLLEREGLILDFDEARQGIDHHGEVGHLPDWLLAEQRAWAAVPLIHHDRLVGVAVLVRPPVSRRLDWEDFDLLSIAGRQVASYLAEQSGQHALEEVARFDEFNRRMAFVMHDIKNLSSQMSLLLRNAERHADNPEFRKDMLVTLRNSVDKLNTMLSRLGRYGTAKTEMAEAFDLGTLARDLKTRFERQHPIELNLPRVCQVVGIRDALDQALSHLVQNAIDASPTAAPVSITVDCDALRAVVTIADSGPGMSPAFVRDGLFRPFVSSKDGGFGIGACEARELVRGMGGRLDVDSREGFGTRFSISLPMAEAARLIGNGRGGSHNQSEAA
ncbi:XrtA/PEP-CTERM system histidine kinase PrsK [Qipengyuania sp. MTN3-11]|uniref:XrtA/PEP-CTERM system histidine kinase PrsK n=1 Tax=Qipengyuania sp. MTN3-11 TaxID=3056557 RepID=UPI0036F28308